MNTTQTWSRSLVGNVGQVIVLALLAFVFVPVFLDLAGVDFSGGGEADGDKTEAEDGGILTSVGGVFEMYGLDEEFFLEPLNLLIIGMIALVVGLYIGGTQFVRKVITFVITIPIAFLIVYGFLLWLDYAEVIDLDTWFGTGSNAYVEATPVDRVVHKTVETGGRTGVWLEPVHIGVGCSIRFASGLDQWYQARYRYYESPWRRLEPGTYPDMSAVKFKLLRAGEKRIPYSLQC